MNYLTYNVNSFNTKLLHSNMNIIIQGLQPTFPELLNCIIIVVKLILSIQLFQLRTHTDLEWGMHHHLNLSKLDYNGIIISSH